MKMVKVLITLLFWITAIAIASPVVVPLSGDWEWLNAPESQTFSIHLEQHGRNLIGQYCAVTQSGNKIDCDADKNPNIHGMLDETGTIAVVDFSSFFGGDNGKASLNFDGKSLMWHITRQPVDGQSYAPTAATLIHR
ncbi:hypothetical protein FHW67_003108 [Herbaspirillum sp. Sphag1AN]|uniref:hypothetical protein n=1 Tax=unclassified Herbaspirillum TaxID=2624150 RepID=UPI0016215E7E|nr:MULTISPECIES: hypothetical protein [unclassified Herbaspirillum]MBB3213807.1 hypothetical protein [Herbaspirillum sp. Sphag1AN]MBB3247004.1 hypothetical protein [Herbaspirillum sp. Sphag64]